MPRKNPAAVALGRKGGKVTSARKVKAAKRNGRKGGRPHAHAALATKARDVPYGWCVQPWRCVEGAHGNVTRIDVCRCGAQRQTNINQNHVERGSWVRVDKLPSLGSVR